MDYLYEQLGPDRFQHLCQALLLREFPGLQCFPIRQPDGGRDAISESPVASPSTVEHGGAKQNSFTVFQVKYQLRPHAELEPHKWLESVLAGEAVKLASLIPKGARAFYLITNVPGTAHPDVGSIDQVRKILGKHIKIESHCWWRDDLNRRLDNAWELKWSYPELMTGRDLLGTIIEAGLLEGKERRTSAIRAFIGDQFSKDETVRFKQVELQNNLLDLFVDVPVAPRQLQTRAHFAAAHRLFRNTGSPSPSLGAAKFFLTPGVAESFPCCVLEGAPGQGKSTLAQYLCQIHRIPLLQQPFPLSPTVAPNAPTSSRLPIRVDLRDYATWLGRRDPFHPEEETDPPQGWSKSLEAFLAAVIRNGSGGAAFDVSDLLAVARVSALLLLLDGLDEVADLERRREVVSEVVAAAKRLSTQAASLQLIITSRPAAFDAIPSLPLDLFPHFELRPLEESHIVAYADKWAAARRLSPKDAAPVKKILSEKMKQPHFRELTRNSMQLAILLSLIYKRGASLPDKRTALYDTYVELFLDRESEKSEVVRDNRDLLKYIHGHLAWTLHSESQLGRHSGSVTRKRLWSLIRDYLVSEGRETRTLSGLFSGIVERVVFLVSRVEGTYEFEVQPLREFFVAQHLYLTAPNSPAGAESSAAKPDRFNVLARNSYWTNVARFYAGCYSKGELPSLVEGLSELASAPGFRHTSHPRTLAAMLLSDWVFAQNHRSTRAAIALVLEGIGLRAFIGARSIRRQGLQYDELLLPDECGRRELVAQCIELLKRFPHQDYAEELASLAAANGTHAEIDEAWSTTLSGSRGVNYASWLEYGIWLGALPRAQAALLERCLPRSLDAPAVAALLRAGHGGYLSSSEERLATTVNMILDGRLYVRRVGRSILSRFGVALDPTRYDPLRQTGGPIPAREVLRRAGEEEVREPDHSDTRLAGELAEKCKELVGVVNAELERPASEWAAELEPWENVTEACRRLFGDRWAAVRFALRATRRRENAAGSSEFRELLDSAKSLCRRALYASARSQAFTWWLGQLSSATNEFQSAMVLAFLLQTARTSTVMRIGQEVSKSLDSLSEDDFARLVSGPWLDRGPSLKLEDSSMICDRLLFVLARHSSREVALRVYEGRFRNYDGPDKPIWRFCAEKALEKAIEDKSCWSEALTMVQRAYSKGVDLYWRHRDVDSLPLEAAERIAADRSVFPRAIVAIAERTCKKAVESEEPPVGKTAEREGWFKE